MSHLLKVNGKPLHHINGKPIRNLIYQGVTYSITTGDAEVTPTVLNFTIAEGTTAVSVFFYKLDTTPTDVYVNSNLMSTLSTSGEHTLELTDLVAGDYTLQLEGEGVIVFNQAILSVMTVLTAVTLGTNYGETIGANAFASASALVAVEFSKTLLTIEAQAFANTKIVNLVIGDNVTTIRESAFLGCPLKTIVLPASISVLEKNAFAFATSGSTTGNLNEITFKNKLNQPITFGSQVFRVGKSSRTVNIYHYGNDSVLDYNWSGDNISPVFIDLNTEA